MYQLVAPMSGGVARVGRGRVYPPPYMACMMCMMWECLAAMASGCSQRGHLPKSYQYVGGPYAGAGPFPGGWRPYDTISTDMLPRHRKVTAGEFLTWEPPESDRLYAAVGAPPLENYSDVSVAFVNHSLGFADVMDMVVGGT